MVTADRLFSVASKGWLAVCSRAWLKASSITRSACQGSPMRSKQAPMAFRATAR